MKRGEKMDITLLDQQKFMALLKKNDLIYISDIEELAEKKYTKDQVLELYYKIYKSKLTPSSSNKMIAKTIFVITLLLHDLANERMDIPKDLIEQLRTMKQEYYDFVEKQNKKSDADILEKLQDLTDAILRACVYTTEKEEQEEVKSDIQEYLTTIAELEKKGKQQEKAIDKRNETIEKQKQTIKELTTVVKEDEKQIKKSNATISSLEAKLHGQEDQITKFQQTLEAKEISVKTYQEKLEELNSSLTETNSKMSIYITRDAQEKKILEIERDVLKQICEEDKTLDEISDGLKRKNIVATRDEILACLKKIQKEVNIQKAVSNKGSSYKLVPEVAPREYEITLQPMDNHLDLLLVSDWHVYEVDKAFFKQVDFVNNYCIKEGIHHIINLGDFLSFSRYKKDSKYIDAYYQLTEGIIEKAPSDPSISHIIMGGNHDRYLLNYGMNALKKICEEREDYFYLGYDHATIHLKDDLIKLHHFEKKFPELDQYDDRTLLHLLKSYYRSIHMDREKDIYIDLFGHIHRSMLNVDSSYAIVPSLTKDRMQNGAWHIKIYFDENKIKNIIFIPLIADNCLQPVSEMVYMKKDK